MDRLLVSVTPRFFACKENRICVSYVNGGWVRVWERGSARDNEQTLCFIIIQLQLSPSSFCNSSPPVSVTLPLQAISGVTTGIVPARLVSQAPQHFHRSLRRCVWNIVACQPGPPD